MKTVLFFSAVVLSLAGAARGADNWQELLELDDTNPRCMAAIRVAEEHPKRDRCWQFGTFATEADTTDLCSERLSRMSYCGSYLWKMLDDLSTVCTFGMLPFGKEYAQSRHEAHKAYLIATFRHTCDTYEDSGELRHCNVFKQKYILKHRIHSSRRDLQSIDSFRKVACNHPCSNLLKPEVTRSISRFAPRNGLVDTKTVSRNLCTAVDMTSTLNDMDARILEDDEYLRIFQRLKGKNVVGDFNSQERSSSRSHKTGLPDKQAGLKYQYTEDNEKASLLGTVNDRAEYENAYAGPVPGSKPASVTSNIKEKVRALVRKIANYAERLATTTGMFFRNTSCSAIQWFNMFWVDADHGFHRLDCFNEQVLW